VTGLAVAVAGGAAAAGAGGGAASEAIAPEASPAVSTGTRYVGPGEAQVIMDTGMVPDTDAAGAPKPVFYTPEDPMVDASAAEIQNAYQLPNTPTHIVTLDTTGISNSYGGNVEGGTGIEMITNQYPPLASHP
jgi:hypothetical protein